MVTCLDSARWEWGPSVVCLGYFDGVHIGHQALIKLGRSIAVRASLVPCVHSYDVPPGKLLKPHTDYQELTNFQEKCRLLEEAGAQIVAISRFDAKLMHMSGERFFEEVLLQRMQAKHLVAGYDHRFGYRGDTDAARLEVLCRQYGIGLSIMPAVKTADGHIVSSSAVRSALKAGNLSLAEEMLGRPLILPKQPG
ncbi:MAG: adenylyltransferase/cytidyltransferase family protein [Christensenellales bacterium]